jgi:helix-turn-helix protein
LRLISASEKRVITVPSVEFGNLGFDGSWERAYYWVTQLEFKSFKPSSRLSDVSDAQWFEKMGEVNEFILWDNKRQIPWVIESTNRQGNQWRKITVTPRKEMTAVTPWNPQLIKQYDQMLYSDFLD